MTRSPQIWKDKTRTSNNASDVNSTTSFLWRTFNIWFWYCPLINYFLEFSLLSVKQSNEFRNKKNIFTDNLAIACLSKVKIIVNFLKTVCLLQYIQCSVHASFFSRSYLIRRDTRCVKRIPIWSFCGLYFPVFGLSPNVRE